MSPRLLDRLLAALAFAVPLPVYLATMAPCLGFDDAAEFALCASDWSTAHPPGFPAYVTLAHGWTRVFSAAGGFAAVLTAFSAVLGAAGVLCLFLASRHLLAAQTPAVRPAARSCASFAAALGCGFGLTYWQWANAVEVYALQGFAAALLLWSVARPAAAGRRGPFVLAGLAIGLGLANHHATMVLLLPVAASLAMATRPGALRDRRWLWTVGAALGLVVLFYGLLYWRAHGTFAFTFGKPDTLGRLWHHLGGGFYAEGLFRHEAEVAGRTGYLLGAVFRNHWWFLLPLLLGLWQLRRRALPWLVVGHLVLLLVLQSNRTMVANTDSYLIPGLVALALPIAPGLLPLLRSRFGVGVLALALALPIAPGLLPLLRSRFGVGVLALALAGLVLVNLPAANRATFDAGDAWFADFEHSAPKDSVVLLTRWEYRALARFYRAQGRRPDLVLLASDVKGMNRDCVGVAHPDFAAALQPEYGGYLDAIAAVDPDFVYTDYYTLGTKALAEGYAALLRKVRAVAQAQ
ncbi:MAG: DUF2723 domain-containing protein, partial [Planctomycetes bacterium]|nr:DUF2723 domain-containing protein [Planctomycetota bacterium]